MFQTLKNRWVTIIFIGGNVWKVSNAEFELKAMKFEVLFFSELAKWRKSPKSASNLIQHQSKLTTRFQSIHEN